MAEQQGMLGITPEIEEAGRGEDTEVGYIEVGSVVIPRDLIAELPEVKESVTKLIKVQRQDPKQFTVTANNELYAYSKDNAIPAHLTNGEFVIPVQVINAVPELDSQLEQLFTEAEIPYGQYKVGHSDNNINPETGYPEFFFKKAWKKIKRGAKSVGNAISKGIETVVDFGKNFVKALGQGVEDLFEGDLDAVLSNPAVIATASFMFPAYAPMINLGSKAVTGQEITASDLVAAGFSANTNFGNVKIDPNLAKAVNTAAVVADGGDPVEAFVANYGSDFAKDLGLDKKVNSALASTVGDEYAQKIASNIDFNKAAADYAAGTSTERILANQFGDDLVAAIGSDDPSVNAAGYAGLETALLKAEGASDQDAMLGGAKTYYNKGGQFPDVGQIASLAGLEEVPEFDFNTLVADLNLDFPTLSMQGYDLPSLSGLGIDLNNLNIQAPDILTGGYSLPEVADLGVDLGKVDFSGYKTSDIGDYNLKELGDMGIDVNSLDLNPEFQMIGLAQLLEGEMPQAATQDDEEVVSLDSEFDIAQTDDPLFSREVLGRTFT